MAKKKGGAGRKGKKPHKNKPTGKKYTKFQIEDGIIKRSPHCPRCGPGVFLAVGHGRRYCGKCHYTEFESKNKKI